jgi:hypothetical protein
MGIGVAAGVVVKTEGIVCARSTVFDSNSQLSGITRPRGRQDTERVKRSFAYFGIMSFFEKRLERLPLEDKDLDRLERSRDGERR